MSMSIRWIAANAYAPKAARPTPHWAKITIEIAIQPWPFTVRSPNQPVNGQGWIAIAIVIFAQWGVGRAAFGAYAFAAIQRMLIDIQGPQELFGFRNPFYVNHSLTFFLGMVPYILIIAVLVAVSGKAIRKRIGSPTALGIPYV